MISAAAASMMIAPIPMTTAWHSRLPMKIAFLQAASEIAKMMNIASPGAARPAAA